MKNVIWCSVISCVVILFILSICFLSEGDKRFNIAESLNKETIKINKNMGIIYSDSFKKDMENLKVDRVNQYVETLGNFKNETTISIMLEVYKEGYSQGFNDMLYTFIK